MLRYRLKGAKGHEKLDSALRVWHLESPPMSLPALEYLPSREQIPLWACMNLVRETTKIMVAKGGGTMDQQTPAVGRQIPDFIGLHPQLVQYVVRQSQPLGGC